MALVSGSRLHARPLPVCKPALSIWHRFRFRLIGIGSGVGSRFPVSGVGIG